MQMQSTWNEDRKLMTITIVIYFDELRSAPLGETSSMLLHNLAPNASSKSSVADKLATLEQLARKLEQ